jgi:hypothetical protein
MLAFVMFFSQPRTLAGDAEMQTMTRELVDAVLETGADTTCLTACIRPPGSLAAHIRKPNEFFNLKKRYDPQELFQNEFYQKYGSNR